MSEGTHRAKGKAGIQTRIAITGANSHIAKGLISRFIRDDDVYLHLFARKPGVVRAFLEKTLCTGRQDLAVHDGYQAFARNEYDVVINCVGLGTVSEEPHVYTSFFTVTEEFDALIISYLVRSPRTVYVNFSSGAVYGGDFLEPMGENTINRLRVNAIARDNSFVIAKLNAEAKHRAFDSLNIIDIRVFSYFSRFVDIKGKYFLTELLYALANGKVFETDEVNIVRDYIHPDDLYGLVLRCASLSGVNTAFDAYSLRPVEKREIIDYFVSTHDLRYAIKNPRGYRNATGHKTVYYSVYRKAETIGYRPRFSSMDTIKQEAQHLLGERAATAGPPLRAPFGGEAGVIESRKATT